MVCMMIDTHAHLSDPAFFVDLPTVMQQSALAGVNAVITIATCIDDTRKCLEIRSAFSQIYATAGIHPHEARTWNAESLREIRKLAAECVAIGEIGLDYYYNFAPADLQREIFRKQLVLAEDLGKPVVIHCRDAMADLTEILMSFPQDTPGGVIHCFTGSIGDAEPLLHRGYYFSFGGMLTFRGAGVIRNTATMLPINRILLETDCPYLAPVPLRGRRNTPANIDRIYDKLAEIRKMDREELVKIIAQNARKCFRNAIRLDPAESQPTDFVLSS